MYPSAYSRYMDDLNSSQGFYVTEGAVVVGGVRRVDHQDDEHYPRAIRAARFAVEDHNKSVAGEAGLLRFIGIVSLNFQPAVTGMYYITMRVEDSTTGRTSVYHAKVWEKLNSGHKVCSFRRAPFSPGPSDDLGCQAHVGFQLEPWMDENYLHYRCFSAEDKILEIHVSRTSVKLAHVWFGTGEDAENFAEKYEGKFMPESPMRYETELRIPLPSQA